MLRPAPSRGRKSALSIEGFDPGAPGLPPLPLQLLPAETTSCRGRTFTHLKTSTLHGALIHDSRLLFSSTRPRLTSIGSHANPTPPMLFAIRIRRTLIHTPHDSCFFDSSTFCHFLCLPIRVFSQSTRRKISCRRPAKAAARPLAQRASLPPMFVQKYIYQVGTGQGVRARFLKILGNGQGIAEIAAGVGEPG